MAKQPAKKSSPKSDTKQKRFVSLFCADPALNATRAAEGAGYSAKTAAQQASRLLRNVKVRAEIEKTLAKAAMGPEEIAAQWTTLSRINLSDFFTKERVEYTPRIEKPFADIVEAFRQEIEFEQELAISAEALYEGKEQTKFRKREKEKHRQRRLQLLRMELELKRDPQAVRIVNGPTEWREEMRLDLAKAHALGVFDLAKGVKPTKFGVAVELPDRLAALERLAKWQGMFVDKVEHSGEMGLVWQETRTYEGGPEQEGGAAA